MRGLFPTHAQRLDRWLGADITEGIVQKMAGWYGPPIPVFGVPGLVYARGGQAGGDFVGPIQGGHFGNVSDYGIDRARKILKRFARGQLVTAGTGFASLSDLISEATTGGKAQNLPYQKTSVAGPAVTASTFTWAQGTLPVAGSNAAAAPGGTNPDNTTTGGFLQTDPAGADTLHLTTWTGLASVVGSVLLYDYFFGVNNSLNATNTAVTGVPGRYQSAEAAGAFITARVTTVLSATATNLTVTYMDQAGNTAEAAAAIAARTSAAVQTIPLTQPVWYIPLNSPDTGVRKITNVQSSGANSGVVDWILGKPLAILPQPVVNIPFVLDGINSAFNLVKIEVDACLCLLDWFKAATGANTFSGIIKLVSG